VPHHQTLPDQIAGFAAHIHDAIGFGFDASAYMKCLIIDFEKNGLQYRRDVPIPCVYKDKILPMELRADFVVENAVVVQVKAAEALKLEDDQEIYTCLKMGHIPDGLLINFGAYPFNDAIRRFHV
jgi:GxxExxY protein